MDDLRRYYITYVYVSIYFYYILHHHIHNIYITLKCVWVQFIGKNKKKKKIFSSDLLDCSWFPHLYNKRNPILYAKYRKIFKIEKKRLKRKYNWKNMEIILSTTIKTMKLENRKTKKPKTIEGKIMKSKNWRKNLQINQADKSFLILLSEFLKKLG